MKKIVLIVGLLTMACSFREPIPDNYHHYIGTWTGSRGSQMIIRADGSGKLTWITLDSLSNTQSFTIDSASVTIEEPVIHFSGALGISQDLTMTVLPWFSNSLWWTVIDSETYSHGF